MKRNDNHEFRHSVKNTDMDTVQKNGQQIKQQNTAQTNYCPHSGMYTNLTENEIRIIDREFSRLKQYKT